MKSSTAKRVPLLLLLALATIHCSSHPKSDSSTVAPSPSPSPSGVTASVNAPQDEFPSGTSYGRLPCSPKELSSDGATPMNPEEITFRSKTEILWGEPVPLCGFLRVDRATRTDFSTLRIEVQLRIGGTEDFTKSSPNFNLGNPPMRRDPKPMETLGNTGELHFNSQLHNQYTILAPGQYDLSLRFLSMESSRHRIVVRPGGWRLEVASFLSEHFCDGTMTKDFSEYLQIQRFLNTSDLDENAAAAALTDLEEARKAAIGPYEKHIKASWRAGLSDEAKLDVTVPMYAINRAKEMCKNVPEPDTIYYLYNAIKHSSGPRK